MSSKIKENSSNAHNLRILAATCQVNQVLTSISPRWKMQILQSISQGVRHFSKLKKAFPAISDQVLSKRLAELLAAELVEKEPLPGTVPPQIAYTINAKGEALLSIVLELQLWGKKDWQRSEDPANYANASD